jgi:hypothetical protein
MPGALFFKPDGLGFSRITVIDAAGAAASVMVRVDDTSSARPVLRPAASECKISPCITAPSTGTFQ